MTRNLYNLLLAGPALVQVVPAAAQGKGVVMVSDLRGSATLGDGTTAVTLMQELPAGSVVLLAKDTYHFKLKDEQGQVLFEVSQEACSVKVPDHFALPDDMTYRWVLAKFANN